MKTLHEMIAQQSSDGKVLAEFPKGTENHKKALIHYMSLATGLLKDKVPYLHKFTDLHKIFKVILAMTTTLLNKET